MFNTDIKIIQKRKENLKLYYMNNSNNLFKK